MKISIAKERGLTLRDEPFVTMTPVIIQEWNATVGGRTCWMKGMGNE